jgi:hypothetical protein
VLIPYISNGPLIFWLYPAFGVRGASWFLGTSEWTFGALLFLAHGTGLAGALRRRRPSLPVVLLSGYSSPILTQKALAAGVTELLTKPLHSREIATTLARVLHPTG